MIATPNYYLVVDCGSTKADWRVFAPTETKKSLETIGFNPSIEKPETIKEIIEDLAAPKLREYAFQKIFFYGAGCVNASIQHFIKDLLAQIFKISPSQVLAAEDLLGAIRATGNTTGAIAAILGTGSNACYFEGDKILTQWGGHGYLLGDEGSGADIGKRLVKGLLEKKISQEIETELETYTQMPLLSLRQAIYAHPAPNRFLGNLAPFVNSMQKRPAIRKILLEAFDDFIKTTLLRFERCKEVPLYFIGSVAWYFKETLEETLQKYGLTLSHIIHKPIERLVEYHQNEIIGNK
jgi:N-acetylglucosamine kinase-like BadF-type ATPase